MPSKRHHLEEIVAKLRQVDVLTSRAQAVADAVRSIGVIGRAAQKNANCHATNCVTWAIMKGMKR